MPEAFGETAGTLTLRPDGRYYGPTRVTFTTGAQPSDADRIVTPEQIDWAMYRNITDE